MFNASYLLCTQVTKPLIIQKPQNQSLPNLQKTHTNIKDKIFEELVPPPSVLPLLKRHIRLGTRLYRGPFRRFINMNFF